MVVRAWRGYAAPDAAEAYPAHVLGSVRPKLEQLAGFRGMYLLRREGSAEIEFLVLTLWDSMEAVRAFAGERPELAVVEPAARAALVAATAGRPARRGTRAGLPALRSGSRD